MTQAIAAPVGSTRSFDRFSRIMPLAFISYGLAFLDRVNYGSAESRMKAALHLSPSVSATLMSLFFYGYFLLQIPAANFASRRNVKWLIFWALILWGSLSGLTGIVRSVPGLVVIRLSLGAVEGVVLPAMLVFLTRWFTRAERSRANALLILANPVTMIAASVVCGFLIDYFDRHPVGRFQGWQMMFIVEGIPSIVWAFIWLAMADERPTQAAWLSREEGAALQEKLDREQGQMRGVDGYWQAFKDPRVILLALMYLCFSAAVYGFMMWLPQIVERGAKQGVAKAGLLTTIPYIVGIIAMISVSTLSDRSLKRKRYVAGSMILGSVGFLIAYYSMRQGNFWAAFLGLIIVGACAYTPCGPLWAWMSDMLPRNVVGESMALVNSFGALGGGLGTSAVGYLKGYFGSTAPAFIFQAGCFALAGLLALVVHTRAQSSPLASTRLQRGRPT